MPMFIWKCSNCGAPLELPDDVEETRCTYCGVTSRVTPPEASLDAPVAMRGSQRGHVGLAMAIGAVTVMAAVAFAVLRSNSASATSTVQSQSDQRSQTQTAGEHAHKLVVERARRLMLEQNCTPLVEATDLRGAYDLVNTLQANPSSPCVTLLGESGYEGNALKLWLNEPSGAAIDTPPLSPSLHMRYCAKTTGSHPARIVPQGEQSYTLAVLECPR
jgi:DNA-directed RNA polymerase subunit RPC12/RpoP